MNEILTLQQISDIDTFTLEQKLEQLEKQPLAIMHEQLIQIVRLQLKERYKIEEFGRKLMNDQINIFPDISIKSTIQVVNKKQSIKSQKKINFAQCLKRSLVTDGEDLFIRRPAVQNYRYTARQPKSTTREKKPSIVEQKKSHNIYSKKQEAKRLSIINKPSIPLPNVNNPNLPIKKQQKKQGLQKSNKRQNQYATLTVKTTVQVQKQSLIKHQKIEDKKQAAKPKIKYIENDVYDEEKLILDQPQKLADISIQTQIEQEIIKNQQTNGSILKKQTARDPQNRQETSSEQDFKQNINKSQKKNQITQQIDNKLFKSEQVIANDSRHNLQYVNHSEQQALSNIQNQKKDSFIVPQFQLVGHGTDQQQKDYINQIKNDKKEAKICKQTKTISQDKEFKKQKPILRVNHMQNKTKSLSQFVKSSKNIIKQQKINQIADLQAIQLAPATMKQQQPQKKQKMDKSLSTFIPKQAQLQRDVISRSLPLQPPIFPYHEIVQNFSKMLPHSRNLINDLRSIQKQLADHIAKGINQISKNDEYLKIRENQLLFKVVSQTQKAQKYQTIFDIELASFVQRSKIMIERIKKVREPVANQKLLLYRVVRQKQDVYDIVNNSFHRTENWYQLPHGMDLKMSWNLLWTWSKPQIDLKELFYFQKVNHFFGNKQIARKDLLKKNIERIKKLGIKAKAAFDIIPETYFLPGENMQFVRKFRQYSLQGDLNYWIMKPVGLSRGRGIELITKIQQVVFSEPVVIQKYLSNPLLLDGYKFDMRIYVLVCSMNPLQAFVYKEGFARISTQRYSLDDENVHNKFVHLTNFSVQKQNFLQNQKPKLIFALSSFQKQVGGCKITLNTLKKKLKGQGISWQQIQQQIDSIVLKSLISTMNSIQQNPNCFQLFGYDIIIDQNLKCWLIEVNSSPSLEKDFTIDQVTKQQLVDDIIQIVDPIPYDRQRLLEVVTRRRKEMQGLKSHINTNNNSQMQLDMDLHYILHGRHLRKYGEPVANQNFRRIAPGQVYQNIIKTVQQYKLTSITKDDQL